MYTAKYELYRNDHDRQTNLTKTFNSLDDLGKWLMDYASPYEPKTAYHMAWDYLTIWNADGTLPSRLKSRNFNDNCDIWVYLVANEEGIVFSGGKYTNGTQHMSKAFMDFCKKLQYDYEHPTFNFVD